MANTKEKTYEIIRTVKEFYEVTATSREEALSIVGEKGDPFEVRVVSETCKVKQ